LIISLCEAVVFVAREMAEAVPLPAGWANVIGATDAEVIAALATVHKVAVGQSVGVHKHPLYQPKKNGAAQACSVCFKAAIGPQAWVCVAATCDHVECATCHANTKTASSAVPRAGILWQGLAPLLWQGLALARSLGAVNSASQSASQGPAQTIASAAKHDAREARVDVSTQTLDDGDHAFGHRLRSEASSSDAACEAVVVSDGATSEGTDTDSDDAIIDVREDMGARRKHAASSAAPKAPSTTADTDSDDAVIDLNSRRKHAASSAASSTDASSKQSSKRPRLSSTARDAVAAAVGGPSGAARSTSARGASTLPKQAHRATQQPRSSQSGRGRGAAQSDTDSSKRSNKRSRRGQGNGMRNGFVERLAEAVSSCPSYTSEQDRAFMEEARAASAAYEKEVSTPNSAMGA